MKQEQLEEFVDKVEVKCANWCNNKFAVPLEFYNKIMEWRHAHSARRECPHQGSYKGFYVDDQGSFFCSTQCDWELTHYNN